MQGRDSERLPDLHHLETAGPPSAILVTHAHLDHIGALPLIHQRYPLTPVFATPPTIALTQVQLLDSLKIMAEEAKLEGEIPLYSEATVASLLTNMVPVKPLRPFRPTSGGPEVTFFPAGHILGACALGIEGCEARVFLSGDLSVDNQRTIPGMRAPRFRADVAVFESTYGSRLHPRRSAEEQRLVETVAATIAEGGKVLVPAFAIGRAQEVILILLRAQLLKQIPEFPVYVDGMVRRVCDIYSAHPWYLQSTLRRRIEKHGDPFFGVLETVQPVRHPAHRNEILAGGAAVIVTSSGMLTGGPSPFYARALINDPKNLISITGYQDEESPGRKLLDAASGRSESIVLEGSEVRPQCKVRAYALSGHAAGVQIAALARALRPAEVFLVHGDSGARRDLADVFVRERVGRVHLPRHGEVLSPSRRQGRRRADGGREGVPSRLKMTGIGGGVTGPPREETELAALASHLRETYSEGASFTADELCTIWSGKPVAEDDALAEFEDAVRGSRHFTVHPTRLFHFKASEPEGDETVESPGANVNLIIERLDALLAPEAGLLKKSYQPRSTHMVLAFAFPDIARERYAAVLEEVSRESGWTFEIHPHPNMFALEREIRSQLPSEALLARSPSVRLEDRAATLYLERALRPEEETTWSAAAAAIRERTGFRIDFAVREGTAPAKQSRDAQGRLEMNLAYRAIRDAFESEGHQPHRTGRKPAPSAGEPYIEVAFISPEVGARYADKLAHLSAEIGWPLQVASVPNQNAILGVARELFGAYRILRGPSFFPQERKVTLRVERAPSDEERKRLERQFEERTGYRLEQT